MKISKKQLKIFLFQAIGGVLFWTVALTPYTIFVVETTWHQYWKWFAMQLVLVPFLAPLSIWFTNWFVGKFEK